MSNDVLSPGDAFSLGDLLNAVTRKDRVRWIPEGSQDIRTGELRSLVIGQNNFATAPWGTDVRDMHVWVTTGITETTFSVRHALAMIPAGGMAFGD